MQRHRVKLVTADTQWYLSMYKTTTEATSMVGGTLGHQRTRRKLALLANPMVVELVVDQNRNYPRLMTEKHMHAQPEKAPAAAELLVFALVEIEEGETKLSDGGSAGNCWAKTVLVGAGMRCRSLLVEGGGVVDWSDGEDGRRRSGEEERRERKRERREGRGKKEREKKKNEFFR